MELVLIALNGDTDNDHMSKFSGIVINVHTCSSSSVRFSPSSLATLFRFLNEILPVSSSSNSRKAFRISSLESFSACNRGEVRVA